MTDRWFYNATITNPGSGNVAPAEAKFEEARTVPLIGELKDFYVALARMSVTGSTANFPVLIPPLAGLTPTLPGIPDVMLTELSVGIRLTVTDTNGNAVGYSEMNTASLLIPSTYPAYPRTDPNSAFYWVEYVSTVSDALNKAITEAFSKTWKFLPLPGFTCPTLDPLPFVVPVEGSAVQMAANFEYLRATTDTDTYKLTLSAPYKVTLDGPEEASTAQTFANPFLGPTTPNNTASPFAAYPAQKLQAHLFFNDKLLDLFPMPTVQPVRSMYFGGGGPINADNSVLPGCNIVSVTPGSLTLCTWLDPDQEVKVSFDGLVPDKPARMYCIQTYPRSGVSITETRITFGTAQNPDADNGGPNRFDVESMTWTQEYSTTGSWSPITGIAITSGSIPVFEEAYGLNIIDPTTGMADPTAGKGSSNIIFDVDFLQDNAHGVQGGVYFLPNTFRWAKCKPGALSTIDLRLLLRKKDGTFVPWMLDSGGTVNIKLMFCKNPY